MKKLSIVIAFGMLAACTSQTSETEAKQERLYEMANLEDVPVGKYIVDERSGCLYFDEFNGGITPVYNDRGEVVGCSGSGGSGGSVEQYFEEDKGS